LIKSLDLAFQANILLWGEGAQWDILGGQEREMAVSCQNLPFKINLPCVSW